MPTSAKIHVYVLTLQHLSDFSYVVLHVLAYVGQ